MLRIYTVLLLCVLISKVVKGQDIHYAQFHAAPLMLNPANTGIFDGDIRYTGIFRSQWLAVPVPYTTFGASFDHKFLNTGQLKNNTLAGGLSFNYDEAGDSELSTTNIGLNAAYTQQVSKNHFLGFGFQTAIGQRRFNIANLTFDEQFVDGLYLPSATHTEVFDQTNVQFVDVSVGVNWLFQITNRLKFNIGTSMFHINKPNYSFFNADVPLALKWNLHLDATIQITSNIDWLPSALFSKQDIYQERVFGSYLKYWLDKRKGAEKGVLVGVWYRLNESAIPSIAVHYATWRAGMSYDVNVSEFNTATNNRGGYEVFFQYIITKVKPLKDQKTCPIF